MSLNMRHAFDGQKVEKSFGKLFSTIDFELTNSLSESDFDRSGRKTQIGNLLIDGHSFSVNLYDLKRISETVNNAYDVVMKKYRLRLGR